MNLKKHNTFQSSSTAAPSGFTIVELLIVIVVIGILAAITIVAYNGIQSRAQASAALSAAAQATKKIESFATDGNGYPSDLATIGLSDNTGASYQYTVNNSANPATYCITATNGTSSYTASSASTKPTAGGCAGHGQGGVAATTNLIPNPSFETSSAGWGFVSNSGYIGAVSSVQAFVGSNSYALTGPVTGIDRYMEMTPYPVAVNGTTYTISAYIYLTGNGATYVNGDTIFDAATGTRTGGPAATYDRTKLNQWQRISRTFTMTSAGTIRIRFNVPLGSTTYVDGVMLTATPLSGYADGNTANWVWNGATNLSTSTGPPL